MKNETRDINGLKQEFLKIASNMQLTPFIIETLSFVLTKNSFVYNAEPLNNLRLVNLIVTISKKISSPLTILVEPMQLEAKQKYFASIETFGNIVSIAEFNIHDLNTLIVVDDIVTMKRFVDFEQLVRHINFTKIIIGLINSPFLFLDLVRSNLSIHFFTPVKYDELTKFFFKSLIEDSNIISYESFESILADETKKIPILKFVNNLKVEKKSMFEYLNRNGLFSQKLFDIITNDSHPFIGYTSDKLSTLRKILKILKDRKNCVIVKDITILNHLLLFFDAKTKLLSLEINTRKYDVDVEIFPHSKLNVFDERKYENVIFFDFYPIKITKMRYILCSEKEKKLFKRLLTAEEIIETEIKSRIISKMEILDCNENKEISKDSSFDVDLNTESYKQNDLRTYQFKIMLFDDSFESVREKIRTIALKIISKGNYALIFLKTCDPFATSFLLSKCLKLPVYYPLSQIHTFSNVLCNSFSSGHINFYNSFISKNRYVGFGYAFFEFNKILFFHFSQKMNIRINIEIKNLEKKMHVDYNFEGLFLHLALKNYPKVYIHANLSTSELETIKTTPMSKKFGLLDRLEWERASINECKFFENAYDLRIEICQNSLNNTHRSNETQLDPSIIKLLDTYKKIDKSSLTDYYSNRYHNNLISKHHNTRIHKLSHLNMQDGSTANKSSSSENNIERLIKNTFTIQALLNKIIHYEITPIITVVYENHRSGKSLNELRKSLQKLSFTQYYFLEILFTKKDRFIDNKINDINIFNGLDIKQLVNYLDLNLKNRFIGIDEIFERYKIYALNIKSSENNCEGVRQVIVTPFRVKCLYPQSSISNRVLRNFDPDKFIRVSFKDEDNNQIWKGSERDNTRVYDNIKNTMRNGIMLGQRKYFFLAMSSSQLKLHSAWFITPYMLNDTLIGADYIRSWLGDFKPIHNIGKYAVRLGQGLSTTIDTVEIKNIFQIDEIERNGYCFSDGIGRISYELACEVMKHLKTNEIPSAFQIRIGGYKGVVSLLQKVSKSPIRRIGKKKKLLESDDKTSFKVPLYDTSNVIYLRKSMKKFDSDHKILEVITFSQNLHCNLNRQIILLLESLGISGDTFLEMQDNIISRFILSDPSLHIKKYCSDFPLNPVFRSERFYLKMFDPILKKMFEELVKKTRVQVCKGRLLMGILDEYGVLEENEIFIHCSPCIDCVCQNEKVQIITGKVAIAKNPCLHPGDIRIVKAVHKNALLHLKDVIVFSSKGNRPVFNMCSGSDLDGDLYFCTWDPRLIPDKEVEPESYTSKTVLYKKVVSMDDIINFYTKFMRENQLGLIANAHLALSDKLPGGVNEKECIRLARLFNLGVDFPKTGYVPRLPIDLQPESFPDFMEQSSSYKSSKVLGFMYRRVFMFSKLIFVDCECQGHPSSYVKKIYHFKCRNPLKGLTQTNLQHYMKDSNCNKDFVKTANEILSFENESLRIYQLYKQEINLYLYKNGFKSEYDAFLGFSNDPEIDRRFNHGLRDITKKYKNTFFKNFNPETAKFKAFSWYKVSHESCEDGILSFPWIISDVLIKNCDFFEFFLDDACNLLNLNPKGTPIENLSHNAEQNQFKDDEISKMLKKKNIPHSKFKLNGKIIFIDSIQNIQWIPDEKKKRPYLYSNDIILIPKNHSVYNSYEARISNSPNMKELFLLLYSIRFFVLENIKCMFEFFVFLTDIEKNDPSRNNICNFLIILSQESYKKRKHERMTPDLYSWIYKRENETIEQRGNTLLLIAFIFSLKHTLGVKIIACENFFFKDKEINNKYVKNKSVYFHKKPVGISVSGMFDTCDLVYMKLYNEYCLPEHTSYKKYILSLLNPGKCSVINYKDDLRMFLLQNASSEKTGFMNLKVSIIPGKFYYYNIDNFTANNNLEIRVISQNTIFKDEETSKSSNKLLASFVNRHQLLEDNNKEYIVRNSLSVDSKRIIYILHISRMGINYCIYYNEIKGVYFINKITRNSNVNGRFVIVAENDTLFETIKEDVIYCKMTDFNVLFEHENILLNCRIMSNQSDGDQDRVFTLISKEKILGEIRIETIKQMKLKSRKKGVIQVVLKYVYRNTNGGNNLLFSTQETNCYCSVEQYFNEVNFKTFDGFFEEIWELYQNYF